MPVQCKTCPFRDDVDEEHKSVMVPTIDMILGADGQPASRICHSTGNNNAFHRRTGKKEMICRGARNFQLQFFAAIGFLESPTDAAWLKKCRELGIQPDQGKLK
jgi:hypothetical protein